MPKLRGMGDGVVAGKEKVRGHPRSLVGDELEVEWEWQGNQNGKRNKKVTHKWFRATIVKVDPKRPFPHCIQYDMDAAKEWVNIYDVGNVLSQEFDPRRGRWASGGASPVKRAAAKAPNAKSATSEAADAPKATPKSAKAKGKVNTAGKGRAVMPSKKPRYMFISSVVSSPNSTPPKGEATNRAGHARQAPADTSAAAAWAGAAAAAASPPTTATASPSPNVMVSPISTAKRGGSTPGSSTPARAGATRTVAKALDTPGRSLRSTPGAKKHIEVQEEGAPPRAAGFASISAKKPQLAALEAVLKGQYAQYANNKPKRSAPKRKAEAKEPTDDDVFLVEKVLDVKKEGRRTLYEVKWAGYPDSENTWEPAANLKNCESFHEFIASRKQPTKKLKVV